MASLCPECAHRLYGYPACNHEMAALDSGGARCARCGWNGSTSEYLAKRTSEAAKEDGERSRRSATESDDAAAIARIEEALSGAAHPIEVCRWLLARRDRLSIDENDPALLAIVGVHSETDAFYLDITQRALWNPDALARKDAELAAYLEVGGVRPKLEALGARLRWAATK